MKEAEKSMTDFNLDAVEPKVEHLDLISPPERMYCWGFDLVRLTEAYGNDYGTGVYKALLEGLGNLSESKNERRRGRRFAVWGGDYLDRFWVGVPADLSADVMQVLGRRLRQVTGYCTAEYGHTASLPFLALFRYDHGQVIEYSDDAVAGQEHPNAHGSGVTVSYRMLW